MSKEKNATVNPLVRDFFQAGIYKRNQGRIARQVTGGIILLVVVLGAYRLYTFLINYERPVQLGVPVVLGLVGAWAAFRVVNMPNFADFLIAVEAEMNKVSWPSRREMVRSVIVVILTIVLLAGLLYLYDI